MWSKVAQYALFDFFLPAPSLSTTSSRHTTRGRFLGAPRRRSVPTAEDSASLCVSSSRGWLSCTVMVRDPSAERSCLVVMIWGKIGWRG